MDERLKNGVPWASIQRSFRCFKCPLFVARPSKALTRPNTVVLTQRTATRLLATTNPIGKILEIVQGPKLEITGVCADPVKNAHFTFNFLASVRGQEVEKPNHISFSAHTYLLLKPNTSPETVERKLPAVVEKYAAGEVERTFGVSFRDYLKAGNGYFYFLQPLRSIHLDSHLEAEHQPNGSRSLVSIFSIIAAFVLLIACINFMNLATARSSERAREVGIRKSLGSTTGQLAAQFLTESVLLSLFSLFIGVLLVAVLLAPFNTLAGKSLSLVSLVRWETLPLLLGGAVAVGLLAGSYPAGVLSAFEPIKVLKGKFSSTRQGHLLRNGLVVFQFAVSVLLIVSTIVVYNQLDFIQQKELGFSKESVIKVKGAVSLDKNTESFKQEVAKLAGVSRVGAHQQCPRRRRILSELRFRKNGENETVTGKGCVVDDQYLQTLRMNMLAGRPFTRQFDDSLSVILNEEAVQQVGLTDPIGKQITSPDNFAQRGGPPVTYTVVGIVRNFHFGSLHQRISPLFILNDRVFGRRNNEFAVRVQADAPGGVVGQIEDVWKRYLPDQPFHYSYLDADWGALYQSEQVAQRIFGVFAMLAIFIACMGLLGLAMYVIRLRTKEIGIRKVLGASTPGLVALLSKDFLKLVLIAIVIATPIAWYVMDRWLQDFAYHIDIEWWVFVVAGLLAVGIALLTVSFQSIRAALMNPVKSR